MSIRTNELGFFDALDEAKKLAPESIADLDDWLAFVTWRQMNRGLVSVADLELLAEGFAAAWARRGTYPQREGGNP